MPMRASEDPAAVSKDSPRLSCSIWIDSVIVFLCALAVFLISPVQQMTDSKFTLLVSQSLIEHHSFWLDPFLMGGDVDPPSPFLERSKVPRHLAQFKGHVVYGYPPGSSILSVPFVIALKPFGLSAAGRDHVYDRDTEANMQRTIAAILMAGLVCLFYRTARVLLPRPISILAALGAGAGTQVWSTASRGLWSHTWGIFLLGVVILLLVLHQTGKAELRPMLWATLGCWMYFVRPTYGAVLCAMALFVFKYEREKFPAFAGTAAAWLGVFVLFSMHHFGQPVPPYYRGYFLGLEVAWTGLMTHLFSPSRGLIIFVPVILFIIYLNARYFRFIRFPRLFWLGFALIVIQIIAACLFSGSPNWWGGHAYGPRTTTDLVPWFFLMGILGLDAAFTARASRTLGLRPAIIGSLLLAISVLINARGGTSIPTWYWNSVPKSVESDLGLVWDWRRPQFLAGLRLLNPRQQRRGAFGHTRPAPGGRVEADTSAGVGRGTSDVDSP